MQAELQHMSSKAPVPSESQPFCLEDSQGNSRSSAQVARAEIPTKHHFAVSRRENETKVDRKKQN